MSKPRRNHGYSFDRVQVLVRVHKDDRKMIQEAARQLNKQREARS